MSPFLKTGIQSLAQTKRLTMGLIVLALATTSARAGNGEPRCLTTKESLHCHIYDCQRATYHLVEWLLFLPPNEVQWMTDHPLLAEIHPILVANKRALEHAASKSEIEIALKELSLGLTEREFAFIIGEYFKKDTHRATNVLTALGVAHVKAVDIALTMKGVTEQDSKNAVFKAFNDKLIDMISGRIPPGQQGIKQLIKVTELLDSRTSGNIFERWLIWNRYPIDRERMVINVADLKGKGDYKTETIESDHLVKIGTLRKKWRIVEMKHYLQARKLDGEAVDQLHNYRELIQNQVTYEGLPITEVEYIFSRPQAAVKNVELIRSYLGENVKVYYYDQKSGELVEIP